MLGINISTPNDPKEGLLTAHLQRAARSPTALSAIQAQAPPLASVTKCFAMARSLRRPGALPLILALVALALHSAPSFVPNAAPQLRGSLRPQRIVRYADPEEVTALAKLEQDTGFLLRNLF